MNATPSATQLLLQNSTKSVNYPRTYVGAFQDVDNAAMVDVLGQPKYVTSLRNSYSRQVQTNLRQPRAPVDCAQGCLCNSAGQTPEQLRRNRATLGVANRTPEGGLNWNCRQQFWSPISRIPMTEQRKVPACSYENTIVGPTMAQGGVCPPIGNQYAAQLNSTSASNKSINQMIRRINGQFQQSTNSLIPAFVPAAQKQSLVARTGFNSAWYCSQPPCPPLPASAAASMNGVMPYSYPAQYVASVQGIEQALQNVQAPTSYQSVQSARANA